MPLYDLQCTRCQTIREALVKNYQETLQPSYCPECSIITEWETLPALPTMKPDKHWSGTTVNGNVVYSDKEYKDAVGNVEPATRANKEWVEKQAVKRKQEHEAKKEERRDKFFQKIANDIDLPT